MSSVFRETRNVELSLLKYLQDSFAVDWSDITLMKSFKDVYAKNISLPVVCVRVEDTNTTRRELGATTLENRYLAMIDIFATSHGQRLDLSDYIKNKLKDGWVHYDHSHPSGDNTTLDLSANGRDFVVDFVADSRIEFGETGETKDRFRQLISVRIRKSS